MRKQLTSYLLIAFIILAQFATTIVLAKDEGFNAVVKLIESHYRVKHKSMGFAERMGMKLARVGAKIASADYGNFKVAIFEDQDFSNPRTGVFEFNNAMRSALEPDWMPLVQVRSMEAGEYTYIYTREAGDKFKLLVVTIGRRDGTVVQVDVSEKKFFKLLNDPERMGKTMNEETTSDTTN